MQVNVRWCGACLLVLLLSFAAIACTRFEYLEYSVTSPDGIATLDVEINSYRLKPVLRLTLKDSSTNTTLYYNSQSEVYISFAEVAWGTNSDVVGILINNPYGQSLLMGYSRRRRTFIDPQMAAELLREKIRSSYLIPGRQDPLSWVASVDAQQAYYDRVKSQALARYQQR
jgi:hypothetical protein